MREMDIIDGYMIPYHPYKDGKNKEHDDDSQTLVYLKRNSVYDTQRKWRFEERIVQWLEGILGQPVTSPIVIAIAPGHKQHSDGSQNLLYNSFDKFLGWRNIIDGRCLLRRIIEVPKSATGGIAARDQTRHEQTIEVGDPATVKNKIVYIFDDVWTTGATLLACAQVVKTAGAAEVKLFAVGKTD